MKLCTYCRKEKELFDFDKRLDTKDGYRLECKFCRRLRQNKYNKTPQRKKKLLEYSKLHPKPKGYWFAFLKKRRDRIKRDYNIGSGLLMRYGLKRCLAVFEIWGRKCFLCGSNQDLTFHHLDGKGRHYYEKYKIINNDPNNLQVLCRRCHGSIEGKKGKGIKHKSVVK